MTPTERLVDVFAESGVVCAEEGVLDEAVKELDVRLTQRLRATANATCDSPPDLHGLCMQCGRKIAPAIASHQPGCDPLAIVVLRLYRLTVRIRRLGRLMWAAAQRDADLPKPGKGGKR